MGQLCKINVVSEGVSATAYSRRCTDRSASHMLSLRHSIGKRSPFVPLTEDAKSVLPFHCYTNPHPTQTFAKKRYKLIFCISPHQVYGFPRQVDISPVFIRELSGRFPAVTCAEKKGGSPWMISFKGAHFVQDIILAYARWYVAYPLSY